MFFFLFFFLKVGLEFGLVVGLRLGESGWVRGGEREGGERVRSGFVVFAKVTVAWWTR